MLVVGVFVRLEVVRAELFGDPMEAGVGVVRLRESVLVRARPGGDEGEPLPEQEMSRMGGAARWLQSCMESGKNGVGSAEFITVEMERVYNGERGCRSRFRMPKNLTRRAGSAKVLPKRRRCSDLREVQCDRTRPIEGH